MNYCGFTYGKVNTSSSISDPTKKLCVVSMNAARDKYLWDDPEGLIINKVMIKSSFLNIMVIITRNKYQFKY